MQTKLDHILGEIDPSRTIDPVQRRVDEAVERLPKPWALAPDHPSVRDFLTRLFVHVECAALCIRSNREPHPTMDWSRCCNLLKKRYGPEAEYVAIQRALQGHDGGLTGVVRDLAALMAEEYAQNEINSKVTHLWNRLTVDEKLEASKEYVRKFGHLLGSDITGGGAARLRAFFPKFLEQHPGLLTKLRRLGR